MKQHSLVLLWLDAGNKVTGNLTPLLNYIEKTDVWSHSTPGNVQRWTHPAMVSYMGNIAPRGSSRMNHRQDQAAFTLLMHQNGFTPTRNKYNIEIQQDKRTK